MYGSGAGTGGVRLTPVVWNRIQWELPTVSFVFTEEAAALFKMILLEWPVVITTILLVVEQDKVFVWFGRCAEQASHIKRVVLINGDVSLKHFGCRGGCAAVFFI